MTPQTPTDEQPDLGALMLQGHEMIVEAIRVHHERWGLGDERSWSLDQRSGTIVWRFDDVTVSAPAQVLGSWSPDSGTFVWSWDNPTIVPGLQRTAEIVRTWGVEQQVFALTASPLRLEEQQAMDLVALAFRVGGCTGLVPPARGSLATYVVFGDVEIRGPGKQRSSFSVDQP